MRKIVIAGSAKFYKEVLEMKKELENNDYNVIDYPKNINVNLKVNVINAIYMITYPN